MDKFYQGIVASSYPLTMYPKTIFILSWDGARKFNHVKRDMSPYAVFEVNRILKLKSHGE